VSSGYHRTRLPSCRRDVCARNCKMYFICVLNACLIGNEIVLILCNNMTGFKEKNVCILMKWKHEYSYIGPYPIWLNMTHWYDTRVSCNWQLQGAYISRMKSWYFSLGTVRLPARSGRIMITRAVGDAILNNTGMPAIIYQPWSVTARSACFLIIMIIKITTQLSVLETPKRWYFRRNAHTKHI